MLTLENNMEKMRLDKLIGEMGLASRREAKDLILAGLISVNGKVVKIPSEEFSKDDKITIKGSAKMPQKETFIVYKPKGYLSSPDEGTKNIFSVFPHFKHLNCVGRLDKDTEGLILLSNEGIITKAVTGTGKIGKEYEVTVREEVIPGKIKLLEKGIKIEGGYLTKPAEVKKIDRNRFLITIYEGKKHQVRRMANAINLTITNLKRTKIGHFSIGRMKPGQFKKLTKEDIEKIKSYV